MKIEEFDKLMSEKKGKRNLITGNHNFNVRV